MDIYFRKVLNFILIRNILNLYCIPIISVYEFEMPGHPWCLLLAVQMKRYWTFQNHFTCNEPSNQSLRLINSAWSNLVSTFKIEFLHIKYYYYYYYISIFRAGKHLCYMSHWSPAMRVPSAPSLTKIQVVARGSASDKMPTTTMQLLLQPKTAGEGRRQGHEGEVALSFFPGSLFPWPSCPGGMWNQAGQSESLSHVSHWLKQWPAARACLKNWFWISRYRVSYTKYIHGIYSLLYTWYISGISSIYTCVDILVTVVYTMYIPCISSPLDHWHHILGIYYHVYTWSL